MRVGGVDVSGVDPERLLEAFSIAFQDVTVFNGTILENIRIRRKDEEASQAAWDAMCQDFVSKLPDGYVS